MNNAKGTLKICKKGHQYCKSSDCSICPICEQEHKPKEGFLSLLSAPARRALENNRIKTLKQLSQFSEKEILKFHGMGPGSIPGPFFCPDSGRAPTARLAKVESAHDLHRDRASPGCSCPARGRALLPGLAAGSGTSHADEQPRPRGRGAARGTGRLRWLGQGSA